MPAPEMQCRAIAALKTICRLASPSITAKKLIHPGVVLISPGPDVQLARSLVFDGPGARGRPTLGANVGATQQHFGHILKSQLLFAWIRQGALTHRRRRIPINLQAGASCDWEVSALRHRWNSRRNHHFRFLGQRVGSNQPAAEVGTNSSETLVTPSVAILLLNVFGQEMQFVSVIGLEARSIHHCPALCGHDQFQGVGAAIQEPDVQCRGRLKLNVPKARGDARRVPKVCAAVQTGRNVHKLLFSVTWLQLGAVPHQHRRVPIHTQP
mmetsp:Transcript_49001/g.116601  ORF Transcript_49001/g.116601 Transcript_49001/m.116601 type:complete len:268 (+) Transcript_49001:585-1388(+)